MKTIKFISSLFVLSIIFSSCAKQITISYSNQKENTGSVVILPTASIYGSLTVNDSLMVERKHLRKITITNVPTNKSLDLNLTAESYKYKDVLNYKANVSVDNNQTKTQLVSVPPDSNGYWIGSTVTTVACLFILLYSGTW